MPLTAASLATTHRILPNPRAVTLTPKNPDAAPVTGITGYRRPWTQEEIRQFGNIAIESNRASFLLAKETLSGNVPLNGWWITDDEATGWIIQSVGRELEGALFRCTCIKTV